MLSVIIPAFNCQSTITGCVESVCRQLDVTQGEVIIVDDGSVDATAACCDKLIKRYPNVIYEYQGNAGVSAARNKGLQLSHGKYVMFLDSDDELIPGTLSSLLSVADAYDLAIGGVTLQTETTTTSCYYQGVFTPCEVMELYGIKIPELLLNGPCAKIFHADIIRKNDIKFDISVSVGEDSLFVFNYLVFCKKIMACENPVYLYHQTGSVSLSRKYTQNGFENCKAVYHRLMSYCLQICNGTLPMSMKQAYRSALLFYLQKMIANRKMVSQSEITRSVEEFFDDELVQELSSDHFEKRIKWKVISSIIRNKNYNVLLILLIGLDYKAKRKRKKGKMG